MNGFPRRFGPYALAKPLARGGMGALYLAVADDQRASGRDPAATSPASSTRTCVIKTVLPHLADKEYLQRFRDEAKVVVQLSHRNLVPVFDSGQVGGEIYLGMDFIDGKDLRGVWNRCAKRGVAFPMDVAVYIVREMVRGLAYAHGFGDIKLVHRDVSPPNVLVAFDGSVKLTDFGLASSTLKLEKTAPGIIYGKVSYMSPEQARAESIDGRTDLFAAGIILWELLTGRQLFPPQAAAPGAGAAGAGDDAQKNGPPAADELLQRVRNPKILPPSKRATRVPPELDRIALRALAPKLEDRYPNCAAFDAELSAYLAANYPDTDAARVARFLSELYGDDIEAERQERKVDIAEAVKLLRQPTTSPDAPISSLTVEVGSAKPAAGNPAAHRRPPQRPGDDAPAAAGAADARTKSPGPPPAPHRSGRGTVVDHPGASPERRREAHAAMVAAKGDVAQPGTGSSSGGAAQSIDSQSAASVIGSIIGGRYRVRRLCGEGGMGRVYEAEHIDIGKRFALKILHPAYSQTPDLIERLRREARAASRIGHPNVIDVTDSGTTPEGAFFFVMEYLEGRELGEVIFRQGPLEIRRALRIGAQVCRALEAAHRVGVIHRDLKPENVLVITRDGQKDFVKVLDFGIARSVGDGDGDGDADDERSENGRRKLTRPGMAMGTPEYMAPEQAAGRPADARSDVYAVGAILYEMLGGEAAYDGSNYIEILHKKATEAPPSLRALRAEIPVELDALIARTMAKDPSTRPQSMADLEQSLQEIVAHLGSGPTADAAFNSDNSATAIAAPMPLALAGAGGGAAAMSAPWQRWFRDGRRMTAVAGALVAAVALVALGVTRSRPRPAQALSIPSAAEAWSDKAQAMSPSSTVKTEPATAQGNGGTTSSTEQGVRAAAPADADPPAGTGASATPTFATRGRNTGAGGTGIVDVKKSALDAEELLRAQRFAEARTAFSRLTKHRATRGRALVALAEIAFQEKNYDEAVRSARLAASRGGGARARVVLGDAHFRLSRYQEAATAYEQALKLDPGNQSARAGLALASKRM